MLIICAIHIDAQPAATLTPAEQLEAFHHVHLLDGVDGCACAVGASTHTFHRTSCVLEPESQLTHGPVLWRRVLQAAAFERAVCCGIDAETSAVVFSRLRLKVAVTQLNR